MAAADWPIGPARLPAAVTALFAGVIIAGLMSSGLPLALRIVLSLAAAGYTGFHLHRLLVPRLCALGLDGEYLLALDRWGRQHRGRLAARRFASPVFAGFRLRLDGGRHERIGLFRGQLHPDHFRRLLVRLREANSS